MSELISGKEAIEAFLNSESVEFMDKTGQWRTMLDNTILKVFIDHDKFRLKPRTVTLNGVEFSPCLSIGICRIKNEVSIQFKDESDADRLYALLTKLFGFRG